MPACFFFFFACLFICSWIFPTSCLVQAIVQEQQGHPQWGSYAQRLLDPEAGLWRNPSNGGHDDKAHPPIHPTKFSAGESRWSQDHHVRNTFLSKVVNIV